MKGVRENYYVFKALTGIWILALLLIGTTFLGLWLFPLFVITVVVIAVGSYSFRCVYCSYPIVKRKMTIGSWETHGYNSFPGKTCSNCGMDSSGD